MVSCTCISIYICILCSSKQQTISMANISQSMTYPKRTFHQWNVSSKSSYLHNKGINLGVQFLGVVLHGHLVSPLDLPEHILHLPRPPHLVTRQNHHALVVIHPLNPERVHRYRNASAVILKEQITAENIKLWCCLYKYGIRCQCTHCLDWWLLVRSMQLWLIQQSIVHYFWIWIE